MCIRKHPEWVKANSPPQTSTNSNKLFRANTILLKLSFYFQRNKKFKFPFFFTLYCFKILCFSYVHAIFVCSVLQEYYQNNVFFLSRVLLWNKKRRAWNKSVNKLQTISFYFFILGFLLVTYADCFVYVEYNTNNKLVLCVIEAALNV